MNKFPSVVVMGAVSLGLSLGGCRKSSEETDKDKPADTKTATASEAKKSARPQPPVDEGIDVPTEDDFEDSVSAQITETSDLQKALDQLEKEIGK
jgi:hypothetical protein